MKEIITKEMKVQIMEAKLHKKLEGETLRLGIIEKMKPTKMPTWFKEWSETVYQKQPPQWFIYWSENVYQKQPPQWFKDWSENVYQKQPPQWFKDWSEDTYAKDINKINERLDRVITLNNLKS